MGGPVRAHGLDELLQLVGQARDRVPAGTVGRSRGELAAMLARVVIGPRVISHPRQQRRICRKSSLVPMKPQTMTLVLPLGRSGFAWRAVTVPRWVSMPAPLDPGRQRDLNHRAATPPWNLRAESFEVGDGLTRAILGPDTGRQSTGQLADLRSLVAWSTALASRVPVSVDWPGRHGHPQADHPGRPEVLVDAERPDHLRASGGYRGGGGARPAVVHDCGGPREQPVVRHLADRQDPVAVARQPTCQVRVQRVDDESRACQLCRHRDRLSERRRAVEGHVAEAEVDRRIPASTKLASRRGGAQAGSFPVNQ